MQLQFYAARKPARAKKMTKSAQTCGPIMPSLVDGVKFQIVS